MRRVDDKVLVHYKGWNRMWDEWRDLSTEHLCFAKYRTLSAPFKQTAYSLGESVIAYSAIAPSGWHNGVVISVRSCLPKRAKMCFVVAGGRDVCGSGACR